MKTFRVFCADPDATESSSSDEDEKIGEKSSKKKCFSREITIGSGRNDPEKSMDRASPTEEKPGKVVKYRGVRMRPSGKYAAEIRDPFRKVKIWIGTFNTAKEAYDAYCLKKQEFDALLMIKNSEIEGEIGEKQGKITDEEIGENKGKIDEKGIEIDDKEGEIDENEGEIGEKEKKASARIRLEAFDTDEKDIRVYKQEEDKFDERFKGKENKGKIHGFEGSEKTKGRSIVRNLEGRWEAKVQNPKTKTYVSLGTFRTRKQAQTAVREEKMVQFRTKFEGGSRSNRHCCGCKNSDDPRGVGCKEIVIGLAAPQLLNDGDAATNSELPAGVRLAKSGTFGAWITCPVSGIERFLHTYKTPEKAMNAVNRGKFKEHFKSRTTKRFRPVEDVIRTSKKTKCDVIHGSPTSVLDAENENIAIASSSIDNQFETQTRVVLPFTFDEGVKLGIMNEYGQLLGEYSKCDEPMYLSTCDEDDAAID
ncbi:uncharacterized protein LOC130821422 [Amaranthus tricolor]|uniref:uncharacterized protein LOC130821422 n=1 Tax=Amaranthus tricolor TaxID=29722 RepID=UPI0025894D48|nr:uncharacterized protein LOC130821422 [Amaranthus tricolor]